VTVSHKIVGNAMQMVVCQVGEGQTIYAEAGKFLWKTVNVGVETRISNPNQPAAGGAAGGAAGAVVQAYGAGKSAASGAVESNNGDDGGPSGASGNPG